MASKPSCASLLTVDTVVRDSDTGKLSLIGCFSALWPASFPVRVHRFSVVAFIFGIDDVDMELTATVTLRGKKTSIATCTVLLQRIKAKKLPEFHIESIDVVFPFAGVVFPDAGIYDLRLHYKGRLIASRSIAANIKIAASKTEKKIR